MPNCPRPDYDEDNILEDPEAPECEHKHGIIICADCLLPFPSPRGMDTRCSRER